MQQGGLVRPYQSLISIGQQFVDIIFVGLSMYALAVIFGVRWDLQYSVAATASTVLFYLFARQRKLYSSWRSQPLINELKGVFAAWSSMLVALLVLAFVYRATDHFSRKLILVWMILCPVLLVGLRVAVRLFLREIRASGFNTRMVVIAGAGPLAVMLAKNIQRAPWMGIRVAGFYDDILESGTVPDAELGLSILGTLDKLIYDSRCRNFDEIYVALPMREEKRIKEFIRDLSDSPIQVQYVPDIFTFNLINSRIKDVGGLPVISVYDSPHDSVGRIAKRAEDVIISVVILSLIAPVMALIAAAVKFSSPGPIFFKQRRYGINGEEIWVWKFRTMNVCEDDDNVAQAKRGDARITPVGNFLRKTSLDELPQFFNVLQGSMSIVGPRPHAVVHNELYRKEIEGYMQRHLVKPGITGWAQVNGWRGETDTVEKMERRVEHDMDYIRNWSVWLDLKIILMTLVKGFVNKNAY